MWMKTSVANGFSTGLSVAMALFGTIEAGRAQTASPNQVTFTKDVAPILQRACQNCHRPGSIGPMSLLTYNDARPWARAIKQQVVQRNMPPWYIDRTVGIQKFKNDASLSDQEIATISQWVDAGAPMGNAADMPKPRVFDDSDRWHIGKPDLIVTLNKDVIVKAKQADQWLDLPTEDLGLKTDRYIAAMEIKPIRGVKVLHHVESSLVDPEEAGAMQGKIHLEEYAVGKFGDTFPEGTGMLLKTGLEDHGQHARARRRRGHAHEYRGGAAPLSRRRGAQARRARAAAGIGGRYWTSGRTPRTSARMDIRC